MIRSLVPALTVSLLLWGGVPAEVAACIHAQQTSSAKVSQAGQRILVLHDGEEQTTVLRIEVETNEGLSDLALVVPVPAVPTRYATADGGLFDALEKWSPLHRDELRPADNARGLRAKSKAAAAAPPPLELLEPVKAGPFEIQPIKARGEAGATALNAWLAEHGYGEIPVAALGYYTEHEYAYLAVRAVPQEGSKLEAGALPPLSFSFPSENVVVPLRLEAQGVFPVRIYVLSREAIDDADFAAANAKGFEVASTPSGRRYLKGEGAPMGELHADVGTFDAPTTPEPLLAVLEEAGMGEGRIDARVLFADAFGAGAADPSKWTDELILGQVAAAGAAAGDDAEAPEPEPAPEAEPAEASPPKKDPPPDKPGDDKSGLPIKGEDPKATAPKSVSNKGCGCTTTDAPAWSLAWLLLPLARRRRARGGAR